jgi:DUF4097 and DUF4098 domain-containing protein YvlB
MKTTSLFLAAGLLAALPFSAQAKIVRNVEKTFAVQPGGTFKASTSGGDIVIKTGANDQVRVIAKQTIRASNESEADELLKKLELTLAQEGNDVTATSKYASKIGGVNFGIWPPVSVDFEVTLPASFNVELKTSGGDIVCGDLQGKAAANTSGGDVMLGHIGGAVQAHTSGGDIVLEQAAGPAKLHTSGGDIKVGGVLNTLDASTSGGDVSARLSGGLKGECNLSTSGGDIRAVVDDNAAFQLDASTSGGDVEADHLTLTIERGGHGKSKLAGKVNGGGPLLKLRTSGGDIDIKGVPAGR